MAKQKSGLGRGLNALFDDSNAPTHAAPKKEEHKNVDKPVDKNGSVSRETEPEKVSRETTVAETAPVSRETTKKPSSSEVYISEDALEHAKVVSREARVKPTMRTSSAAAPSTAQVFEQRKAAVEQKRQSTPPAQPVAPKPAPVLHTQVKAPAKPKEEKGSTGVVPLDKVQPNPDQPRTNFKPEKIEELAGSIKKEGLLQPILVRKVGDSYQIIAGERRWQACKTLDMKEIPVRFWKADSDKALELALIENIQRSDLNPIEEAYGYKRLMERRGMTQSEVAQTVSKGRSTIANALRLLDLPEEAQQLLFEDKITAGHARAILSIPDAAGRKTLTTKLVNEKLSVRETESIARLLSGRAQASKEGTTKRIPAPASFKKAARGLTRYFSVPVRVKSVQGKNKIEIQFKDEEDLERIIKLIENAEGKKEEDAS